MASMTVIVSEDLETRFRDTVYKKYGMKKGNLSAAAIEAFEMWIAVASKKAPIGSGGGSSSSEGGGGGGGGSSSRETTTTTTAGVKKKA